MNKRNNKKEKQKRNKQFPYKKGGSCRCLKKQKNEEKKV